MARPRLGESERRTRTIGVRVTAAEAAELRERAQAARLSMGAYLRRRALGQRVRIAAELRLGEGRLDKSSTGRMPALLTARSPGSPRSYTPAPVQSLG